jgi:hypothetical protein
MAITTNQQPSTYTPAFNGQWFESTSTQIAAANFTYTVKCTDMITSGTNTYTIKKRLDNKMVFDASNFSKNYIKHYVPNNQYGFLKCTDAVRKIRVNVGETYGTIPAYASGANIDYYVWNGVQKWQDWPSYSSTPYLWDATNYYTLGDHQSITTYSDRSNFLYFLGTSNSPASIYVDTYDASGTFIATSVIANNVAVSDYTDRFVCIDIGHKGMSNVASGVVTGAYPIITNQVASYNVWSDVLHTALHRVVTIGCEAIYTPYVLHFLDRDGNFETLNCSKLSETTVQAEKTSYRKNPYTLTSNTYAYSNFTQQEVVMNSTTTTRMKLNTDFLTETQADLYRYIISSPRVYLDMGSSVGLVPVKVTTNNWVVNKKWNNKLFQVQLDIELTNIDTFQNG